MMITLTPTLPPPLTWLFVTVLRRLVPKMYGAFFTLTTRADNHANPLAAQLAPT